MKEESRRKLKACFILSQLNYEDVAKALGLTFPSFIKRMQGEVEFRQSEIDKLLELTNKKYEELF
jgi:hypothetical protein